MSRNIDEKMGYQIGTVAHLLQNQYNEQLAEYDITVAQSRVLYLLVEYGSQTQVELQQHLYIKGSTMNGIIDSLLNKGLVNKKDSEMDKRAKIITITSKGEKIDHDLWNDLAAKENEFMDGFSKEEIALMMNWLKRIKTNLLKEMEEAK